MKFKQKIQTILLGSTWVMLTLPCQSTPLERPITIDRSQADVTVPVAPSTVPTTNHPFVVGLRLGTSQNIFSKDEWLGPRFLLHGELNLESWLHLPDLYLLGNLGTKIPWSGTTYGPSAILSSWSADVGLSKHFFLLPSPWRCYGSLRFSYIGAAISVSGKSLSQSMVGLIGSVGVQYPLSGQLTLDGEFGWGIYLPSSSQWSAGGTTTYPFPPMESNGPLVTIGVQYAL